MANYPHTHDLHDAEDEMYMHWLNQTGFPRMRQLLANQECDDVAKLRSVPTDEALGLFQEVSPQEGGTWSSRTDVNQPRGESS